MKLIHTLKNNTRMKQEISKEITKHSELHENGNKK